MRFAQCAAPAETTNGAPRQNDPAGETVREDRLRFHGARSGSGDDRDARARLAGNTFWTRTPGGGVCLGAPFARPAEKRGPSNPQRGADAPARRPVVNHSSTVVAAENRGSPFPA